MWWVMNFSLLVLFFFYAAIFIRIVLNVVVLIKDFRAMVDSSSLNWVYEVCDKCGDSSASDLIEKYAMIWWFYWLVQIKKSNLEVLLQRHVQMAAEIKNLDTDLQMLVYENYNKFISATDTIKRYL